MKDKNIFYVVQVIVVILFVTSLSINCFAKKGYVSDMLILTIREGPGNNSDILRTIRSNTPVEIIEERNGYYKVLLENGDQGWVENQYITSEVPKSIVVEKLKLKIETFKKETLKLSESKKSYDQELKDTKQNYDNTIKDLKSSLKTLNNKKEHLILSLNQSKSKYEKLVLDSKDIVKVIKKNKRLIKENNNLSEQIKKYKFDSKDIFNKENRKWFLYGAAILLT